MTLLGHYLAKKKMSRGAFARLTGLDRGMVVHYASGYRRPGLEAALAIAKATGDEVPALYWVTFQPTQKRKTSPRTKVAD